MLYSTGSFILDSKKIGCGQLIASYSVYLRSLKSHDYNIFTIFLGLLYDRRGWWGILYFI